MKYHLFAVAALQVVQQVAAWEHAYTWTSGLDQETYEKQMRIYANVATRVRDFVDSRRPEIADEPITEPI